MKSISYYVWCDIYKLIMYFALIIVSIYDKNYLFALKSMDRHMCTEIYTDILEGNKQWGIGGLPWLESMPQFQCSYNVHCMARYSS
jgi:hypothetical protein